MDKWRQQEVHDDEDKKVLVGQNYLVDRDKWNDNKFIKFDKQQRRLGQNNHTHNNGAGEEEDLKYKTFSKRSFRPDFVDPTDNRALVWFVDTAEGEGGVGGEETKREYSGPPVRLFHRKPLNRTDTFRVQEEANNSRNREERIMNRHPLNEPIRVEIKQPEAAVKVVPVGVAAPYNSHRNVTISKRSPSLSPHKASTPISFVANEPIKIIIDRSNNSSVTRDRGSPPPPYSSQNTNKMPQRTFSSSTLIFGNDDDREQHRNRRTVTQNEYSRSSDHKSGYEDVLSAVRAPNHFRQYNGTAAMSDTNRHNGSVTVSKPKPLFVSTVKVKQAHRPAWR